MNNSFSSLDYKKVNNNAKVKKLINNKLIPRIKSYQNFGKCDTDYLWKNRGDRCSWMNACKRVIEDEFAPMIREYRTKDSDTIYVNNNSSNVWCCWLQGEEMMPDVVRMCIDSQIMNLPDGVDHHLLTYSNLDGYVDLPGYLFDNVKRGTLTLTHLSDIIRFKLLYDRGGVWMDSTLFVSSKIPESYFSMPIYSIQEKEHSHIMDDVFYGALCSFLIGGAPKSLLFDFCYNLMIDYQKKHDWLVEAHWINIMYAIAYTNFSNTKRIIDSIGKNNADRQALNNISNEKYDAIKYERLINNQVFHKLNWRKNYIKELDGQDTYYGFACKSVLQP